MSHYEVISLTKPINLSASTIKITNEHKGAIKHTTASYAKRMDIFNGLDCDVIVKSRDGVATRIPGGLTPIKGSRDLIIRLEVSFGSDVKFDLRDVLSEVSDKSEVVYSAVDHRIILNLGAGGFYQLDYVIDKESISERGGHIYLHELDLQVSLGYLESRSYHPYSTLGEKERLKESSKSDIDSGLSYAIRIIDNAGIFGDKYININGKIFRISSEKDSTVQDGVILVSNQEVTHGCDGKNKVIMKYDLNSETMEKLGLFNSFNDAKEFGNAANNLNEEIRHKQQQLKILTLERTSDLEKLKQDHEKEIMEMEVKRKRLEADNAILQSQIKQKHAEEGFYKDMKSLHAKDFYEERSYIRKDSSELIKIIPALLLGAGSVYLAFTKFGNK